MEAGPDILNHNVETVERLQKPVRKRARYHRSLDVLARAKAFSLELTGRADAVHTKSSLMVGLGETRDELSQTFRDLRTVDCDILTIGQYLRPTAAHLPVERYVHPDEFAEMKVEALALGFRHVESAPLVRSSYHARDQVPGAELKRARRQATIDVEGRIVPLAADRPVRQTAGRPSTTEDGPWSTHQRCPERHRQGAVGSASNRSPLEPSMGPMATCGSQAGQAASVHRSDR
jgi:hypothetical protein